MLFKKLKFDIENIGKFNTSTKKVKHAIKSDTKRVPKWCLEGSQGSPGLQKSAIKHQSVSKTVWARQGRSFLSKK